MAPATHTLQEPTSLWTGEDRAWMAGFFEGEGCVSTWRAKSNGRLYSKLTLSQVNPEPLARVHSLCGGTVRIKRVPTATTARCLEWQVTGPKARAVAHEITPLLTTKRRREMAPLLNWQPVPPVTHCKRGHEFTEENTYTAPGATRLHRQCRTCMRTAY